MEYLMLFSTPDIQLRYQIIATSHYVPSISTSSKGAKFVLGVEIILT